MWKCNRTTKLISGALGVLVCAGATLAGNQSASSCRSDVLPPDACVHGYTLKTAAEATAAFNDGSTTAPDVPFQFLNPFASTPYTVKQGTYFYLPFFNADNSTPELGIFPSNVNNQKEDAEYFFNAANGIGLEELDITVDGGPTVSLGPDYVVGVHTAVLPDGATQYVVSAAFLAPLSKGTHTIALHGELDGAAALAAGIPGEFDASVTVIVVK